MKQLFENDEFRIVIDRGLFGLTHHPLFAKFYVVSKGNQRAVLIQGIERAFLMIVLNGLRKAGKTPAEICNAPFLDEFAEAVFAGPNSIQWRACFRHQTPDEVIRREVF